MPDIADRLRELADVAAEQRCADLARWLRSMAGDVDRGDLPGATAKAEQFIHTIDNDEAAGRRVGQTRQDISVALSCLLATRAS